MKKFLYGFYTVIWFGVAVMCLIAALTVDYAFGFINALLGIGFVAFLLITGNRLDKMLKMGDYSNSKSNSNS